jgi:CHAT domain-containing protein
VSLNLGALHVQRGDYAMAARYSREASVYFARVGDHERSVTADTNMADALAWLGDFDEASRIYARARMRAQQHALPVPLALIDMSVALLHLARGQYRQALAGFESSRRQYERLGQPQNLAIAEKQLADAYLELRLLPEALALFDQVLVRFEALHVPSEQAWTLAQRGRVQALLGLAEAAGASFERAAALFAAQGNREGESTVTLARAELALAGAQSAQAQTLAQQAGAGFAAAGLAEGQLRCDVVRAHALLHAGAVQQAQALFDATALRARDLQLQSVQTRCLAGQGLAALAGGHRDAARRAFEGAIELFEEQRQALPGDDLRSAFLGDHLRPYQEMLRMALDANARSPIAARAREVLVWLERFRARALGERLAQEDERSDGAAGAAAGHDDGPARTLRERLNWLYRRAQRLDDEGDSSAALTDEIRRTERDLLERARRDRLAAAALQAAAGAREDDFGVEALQSLLRPADAVVEYGVLDDELFACVVTAGGVEVVRAMASWRDVRAALDSARLQIETLRVGAAPVQRHLGSLTERAQARLARLHTLVWAPLAAALARLAPDVQRVLVVPYAQLGSLPFAALWDGQKALGQRHALALAPSARLAQRGLARQPVPATAALALGESSRLPHVADEARVVAKAFARGQAFVGADATLSALQQHAGAADLIHLACHARFRNDNPMFSALHLADAALTVESAQALRLKPATVVLSACETGLAQAGAGDEMFGLVRAFFVAGAARVLASLWPVDDEVTARFMTVLCAALAQGQTAAASLRQAQDDIRESHPHPFYWSAFVLHGGW